MDRCLDSLKGQPVNIHIVKGVKEWLPNKGRAAGFSMGTAKYMSFIDPDDVVVPEAYDRMLEFDGFDLIHGSEKVFKDGVFRGVVSGMHHAYLIKRGVLPLEDLLIHLRTSAAAVARGLTVKHIDEVMYLWNANEGHAFNGQMMT